MAVRADAMVFAAFSSFLSSVYVVSERSGLSFWTSLLGAGSNVILNLLLIPRIGVQGAAIATFASYALVFLARAGSVRRLLPFSLAAPTVALDVLLLAVQAMWLTMRLPGWRLAQAVCLTALLILNMKPLLLAVKNLFGVCRKGEKT